MKTKKKIRISKRKDGSKFIELNPTLNEAKTSTAVVTFGRFNPPTIGHQKLVDKVVAVAKAKRAIPLVYASHSSDKKKNPLSYDSKIKYLKLAFGRVIRKSNARTIIEVAKELSGRYGNLIIVVGSDRVQEFKALLSKYNGREYNYNSIEVVSAGDRDPDADDVSGMSASKLRALATEGKLDEFRRGLPSKLSRSAEEIFREIRSNMGIEEETIYEEETLDEREALTVPQRRERGRTMRRFKSKLGQARKKARKKPPTPEKLDTLARRGAIGLIRKRFLRKGRSYRELSPAEKVQVDKKLYGIRGLDSMISRIAKREKPKIRQAAMKRLQAIISGPKREKPKVSQAAMQRLSALTSNATKKESFNEEFELFLNERRECPPKKHHMAFTKEGKVKFDRRFKFFRKELDEDFMGAAQHLMEEVEDYILDEKLDKPKDDPCWKGYVKLGMKKKGNREVPNCVPMESANPADREQGTDSLVKIYKKDTPGQNKTESYYDANVPEFTFQDFERGARVRFSSHSMDMADDGSEKEGTIVGSNVQHLRVRSDDGTLYKVRHADAELVEATISGGFEGKKFKVSNKPVRMADGNMRSMPPGKSASSKHGD